MKRHILFFITSFCASATAVFASFENRVPDARTAAMGGAGIALENPPFAMLHNPASGGNGEGWSAGISYAVPFGESSLDSFHGVVYTSGLSFDRDGSAGISLQHYGSSFYRETATRLTYATTIAGPVRAGVSAGLLERDTATVGPDSALGVNIGALAALSSSLNFGIAAFNMNRPDIGGSGEKAPSISFAGASYKPADNVILTVTVENREDTDARLRSGGEAWVLSFLALRAGFTTGPSTFSGGAGFIFKKIQGDLSVVRHPELGTGTWYTMRVSF